MLKIKANIAISDTGFVFNPSTGDSFTLNPTGLELLRMIHQAKNEDEITAHFTEKYDVDVQTFERYYVDFTSMLRQMELTEE